jgi:hypothetical protein
VLIVVTPFRLGGCYVSFLRVAMQTVKSWSVLALFWPSPELSFVMALPSLSLLLESIAQSGLGHHPKF